MKQVIQNYRTGGLEVAEGPSPVVYRGSMLIQNAASLSAPVPSVTSALVESEEEGEAWKFTRSSGWMPSWRSCGENFVSALTRSSRCSRDVHLCEKISIAPRSCS